MAANPLISLYESTYGSLYLAAVMSTTFYGVTCVQTLFYYTHYQNDPLRIKTFVGAIWLLDTIHEALSVSGAYKFIMAALEKPSSIADGIPELILQILLTGMVTIITQGYFIYRIYVFSGKSIVVPLMWVPLAIFQLVATIVYVAKALYGAHGIHVTVLTGDFFVDVVLSSLSVAAVVDVLTAIFMTFLLVRKRSTAGYSSVAHILQRLIVFTINTGIWTASFALLSVILLRIYPRNLRYVMFAIPICSVYCNTLLANLNVRVYFRGKMMEHSVDLQVSEDRKTDAQSGETEVVQKGERS
ncbi:hypothetical protein L210DRAFT_3523197 [Boletus edulis BED1]|uniref:DUF6534 domain-containing protein n=1 Tax=Boletus edulis BED1 TaxID=1328754 RepID=A0AAD4GJE3_BOLED|nr:hypothetical protein L210DRAFT_3523197 [Boletus edulis BED1]